MSKKKIRALFLIVIFTVVWASIVGFLGRGDKIMKSKRQSLSTPLASISSGYIGNVKAWESFFACTSEHNTLKKYSDAALLASRNAVVSGVYDGFPERMPYLKDFNFPKSYVDFVRAGGIEFTNSLYRSAIPYDGFLLFGPDKIGRFSKVSRSHYLAFTSNGNVTGDGDSPDDQYYVYPRYVDGDNERVDTTIFKYSNLDFIQVGYDIDGFLGFVDKEVTKDHEFEAWRFSPAEMGAFRYRSFAELYIFDQISSIIEIVSPLKAKVVLPDRCVRLILDEDVLKNQWRAKL